MAQGDIDDMCFAISDCFEWIDDLILKFWFPRRFLEAPAQLTNSRSMVGRTRRSTSGGCKSIRQSVRRA